MGVSLKLLPVIFFICILLQGIYSLKLQDPPKLILIQQFVRHGARYPSDLKGINLQNLPNVKKELQDNYPHSKGGYLTNAGKRMSYLLGKQMFNIYWKELFGNDMTFRVEKFKVKSLKQTRNIQSGLAHSLGLLENTHSEDIDSIDVPHTIPPFFNQTLSLPEGPIFGKANKKAHFVPVENLVLEGFAQLNQLNESCPKQLAWISENQISERYQSIYQSPKYKFVVEQVQKSLNVTITGANALSRYYSQIESLKGLNFQFPSFFDQKLPSFRDYMICAAINLMARNLGQQLQLSIQAHGMFTQVTNNIKSKLDLKEAAPSWFTYIVHQQQIESLLAKLNLTNIDCMFKALQSGENQSDCEIQIPKACSTFIFEFYEYSASKKVTFKIRYNGQYKKIGFCQNRLQCDVSSLSSWFDTWKVTNLKEICAKP